MYQHQGIIYPTNAHALASLVNPYEPWGNGDAMALKHEIEMNDWSTPEGDAYDWRRALDAATKELMQ